MQPLEQFRRHLDQHAQQVGFAAPPELMAYLAELCCDRLQDPELIPQPSFAERYLMINQDPRPVEFKHYGDRALFFVSILPQYGQRRGLDVNYYASLGQSAYLSLASMTEDQQYQQLSCWFMYLQRFLNSALRPNQGLELFDLFPSR